jgi:acyl-CoA synthetase (AMP-forming)/AMP-acid ligase II
MARACLKQLSACVAASGGSREGRFEAEPAPFPTARAISNSPVTRCSSAAHQSSPACIVLREGEQATERDIRDFCDGQIARYKIPRYVRFMTSFPTVTGKVAKYLLREQVARELAVHETMAA